MVCGLLFSLNLFKVYDIIKLYLCWLIYTIPQLCEFWYYLQPKKILFQIFCNTRLRKALNEKIICVLLTSFFLFEPFPHNIMFYFLRYSAIFQDLLAKFVFLDPSISSTFIQSIFVSSFFWNYPNYSHKIHKLSDKP